VSSRLIYLATTALGQVANPGDLREVRILTPQDRIPRTRGGEHHAIGHGDPQVQAHRVGTTSADVASMAGEKRPALGPSAKYSSQPDESTTFIHGPRHGAPWCRSP